MPLVSATAMLRKARREGYAVPAFAAYTLETVRAVIQMADKMKAPVMIQTTTATLDFAGLPYLAGVVKAVANDVNVPVALHLDHGPSVEWAVRCIREGYTSVMIDASELPFEENIDLVHRVVDIAHAVGGNVEAELGTIGGVEDDLSVERSHYTDPDAAQTFVERTGIDALAPSIGSAHGMYKESPRLDFDRLREISKRVDVPIVLHGASGIPAESVQQAIACGISKVNIATELKLSMVQALKTFFAEHPDKSDPRQYLTVLQQAVSTKAGEIIQTVGAEGKGSH